MFSHQVKDLFFVYRVSAVPWTDPIAHGMSSFDSLIKDTLISSTSVPRRKRRRPNPSPLPAPTCKVYGERNSGTNYLTNLLRLNTNVVLSSPLFEDGWKVRGRGGGENKEDADSEKEGNICGRKTR